MNWVTLRPQPFQKDRPVGLILRIGQALRRQHIPELRKAVAALGKRLAGGLQCSPKPLSTVQANLGQKGKLSLQPYMQPPHLRVEEIEIKMNASARNQL